MSRRPPDAATPRVMELRRMFLEPADHSRCLVAAIAFMTTIREIPAPGTLEQQAWVDQFVALIEESDFTAVELSRGFMTIANAALDTMAQLAQMDRAAILQDLALRTADS
jgi:hypothetical protein